MTTHGTMSGTRSALRLHGAGAVVASLFLALAACSAETGEREDALENVDSKASALVTDPIKFAVIGDFGDNSTGEAQVASLVQSWAPEFVITLGDNNYENGAASTIDANIGQFYHSFIYPYTGSYGAGATQNRFFPALGNHDWVTTGATPYLNYFQLPGNERYYDFVRGPVHFFAVDSDTHEPDGTSPTSVQGTWLKNALAAATEPWKIVYFHHSPFSSGTENGSSTWMQWPFQQWGATAVLSGHEHDYERILVNGFPYFVNGVGGAEIFPLGTPVAGSVAGYNGDHGAMLVNATSTSLQFQFFNRSNVLIDSYAIPSGPSLAVNARLTAESGPVNGIIDPGERVTVALAVTNSGGNATNVVGTLLANSGVTSPTAAQTYGAVLGGNTIEKSFSFTAVGNGGDTITAALQLQDGATNLGTVNSTFVLGTNNNFANVNAITIPSLGAATPYASKITVAGQPTNPSKVTVTLRGVKHTYPDDIDVVLVGPGGQKILLMSDVGGGAGITSATLTFDDAAASKLPDASLITSGTFKPSDFSGSTSDTFASPAPAGPYATTLAAFNGVNPNGDWSLYVVDDEAGDSGAITGGWGLSFTYPTGGPAPDPSIVLTSPVNGASFAAPATVNLAANVTANGHTITTVEFFNGTTKLGADTTAPYAFAWTGVGAGSYALTARATYDAGLSVSSVAGNITVTSSGPNLNPSNTSSVTIPSLGVCSAYPFQIVVSGLPTNPSKVTATLNGMSHTYPDDLDVLLVGPAGQKVILMSDAGGGSGMSNVSLTFDDAAASKVPDGSTPSTGTYKPSDYVASTTDAWASPAPAGPYATTMASFAGQNPNGTWSLYIVDDEAGDSGSLSGGWTLHFTYP
jgi:subtilisin-like proprotein convertase family protein